MQPSCATTDLSGSATANRANAQHSTGPRIEAGKHRSGLTSRTPILPSEGPSQYARHSTHLLDEYKPKTATEPQLVQELADTAWRLNRIPILEADLLSRAKNPPNEQAAIDFDIVDAHRALASLGMHGQRFLAGFTRPSNCCSPSRPSAASARNATLPALPESWKCINTKAFPTILPWMALFFQKTK